MAGTAAGIAKANAARLEKRRERQALAERQANEPTTPNGLSTAPNEAPVAVSLSPVTVEIPTVHKNQGNSTDSILDATEPEAANTVYRIASGKLRAPVAVRAQVSLAVLQGRGYLGAKPGVGGGEVEAAAGAILATMTRALQLRERREGATDAKILPSGAVIEAEKPTDSG
jgi:hypothetical protein